MSQKSIKIVLSIICTLSLILTFQAVGWCLLLLGVAFIISYILQIILIVSTGVIWDKMKQLIYISTIVFFVFCIFREDFGDSARSCTDPISVIGEKLGLVKSAFYAENTSIGFSINLLWFPFIGFQIFGLSKMIRIKKNLIPKQSKLAETESQEFS